MVFHSAFGLELLHLCLSALALMITAYFLPGFQVGSFLSALITAIVIGLANFFIRPFLLIITLPINILTFGLFTFVVNGIVLRICAALLPNFSIKSWGTAFLGALILAIVNVGLHALFFPHANGMNAW